MLPEYDLTQIKGSETICYQTVAEGTDLGDNPEEYGWSQTNEGEWARISPKTLALVQGAVHVHLPEITSTNVDEWYYRLDSLFDAGLGFLCTDTGEGNIPLRIRVQDITDHIGLRVTISEWDKTRFDAHIRQLRLSYLHTKGPNNP